MASSSGASATAQEVTRLLTEASLDKYAHIFDGAKLDALRMLGQREQLDDLKCSGVSTLGHRHRIAAILARVFSAIVDATDCAPPAAKADGHSTAVATATHLQAGALAAGGGAPTAESNGAAIDMLVPCAKFEGALPFHGMVMTAVDRGTYLPINPAFPGMQRVHAWPPVYLVRDFLTEAECDALIRLADPLLLRSKTNGGETESRTSRSCHLRKTTYPCPSILAKVHALTGKPIEQMETPQVARYEAGQYYTMHFDGDDSRAHSGGRFLEEGGQRVCTCLIYLNDVLRGGATKFNRLGFCVAPRKGAAVVFFPGFVEGGLCQQALHEAMPAVDRKYVCQIWLRQFSLPPEAREFHGFGHLLLDALHSERAPGGR